MPFQAADNWHENLQVGSQVIVQLGIGGVYTTTVERITPTQIKLETGIVLDRTTGRRRGASNWDRTKVFPRTEENAKTLRLIVARRKLQGADWANVDDETVMEIYGRVKDRLGNSR